MVVRDGVVAIEAPAGVSSVREGVDRSVVADGGTDGVRDLVRIDRRDRGEVGDRRNGEHNEGHGCAVKET